MEVHIRRGIKWNKNNVRGYEYKLMFLETDMTLLQACLLDASARTTPPPPLRHEVIVLPAHIAAVRVRFYSTRISSSHSGTFPAQLDKFL